MKSVLNSRVFRICPDALIGPWRGKVWMAFNPRVRRYVEIDGWAGKALIERKGSAAANVWAKALSGGKGFPRSGFTNSGGLMADPTGCGLKSGRAVSGMKLFSALQEAYVLCEESLKDYKSFLNPLSSILDETHLGSFHQVLGRYLLRGRHVQRSWRWWHDQKFTSDGKKIKDGLYKWVQGCFFDRYFNGVNLKGKNVLDYACGNGYFSRRFCKLGARVTAVDLSPELIAIAQKNDDGRIKFVQPVNEKGCESFLASLPPSSFDAIYMQDALLFFFHDIKTGGVKKNELFELLGHFHRLLKPGGQLYLMEPNGTFWLSPWMGGPSRAYTIVTEYRRQLYHVAPTFDRVVQALKSAKFLVKDFVHPEIDPSIKINNNLAGSFARTFPLWDFYVCVRGE